MAENALRLSLIFYLNKFNPRTPVHDQPFHSAIQSAIQLTQQPETSSRNSQYDATRYVQI
ncbi:hypothetical protein PITC_062750 [Penicillium italicum]|uniref:Uncharacterized protein n=1 Tax=Penicillium italicum TaxID=40296 RepID=A0A0A2L3V6_PENIT|nr:hypothetical protein PITC_062750 [Penicillium italicum]